MILPSLPGYSRRAQGALSRRSQTPALASIAMLNPRAALTTWKGIRMPLAIRLTISTDSRRPRRPVRSRERLSRARPDALSAAATVRPQGEPTPKASMPNTALAFGVSASLTAEGALPR